MAISIPQNFFKETITLAVASGATNIYISAAPTADSGFLVISPNNASSREIVKFTAKGSDGFGPFVTVTAPNRGLGGTSDIAHQPDEPVYMNVTAEHMQEIDDAIEAINTSGALDASTTTKGIAKLSVAPEVSTDPKVVGDNDPRIPSSEQANFLAGIVGMVVPFAGSTAPTGFLLCDGAAVDIGDYSALFDVIGITYGLSDGEVVTVENGADLINRVGHGYSDDDRVLISAETTMPTGIDNTVAYYVVNSLTNSFQISLTEGGTPVDFSDDGTGEIKAHFEYRVPNMQGRSIIGGGIRTLQDKFFTEADISPNAGTVTRIETTGDYFQTSGVSDLTQGDQVVFATTRGNISANNIYYIANTSSNKTLASSYANAIAGSSFAFSFDSTGLTDTFYGPTTFTFSDLPAEVEDGTEIVLTTEGTLPLNIPAGTYYIIRKTGSDTEFYLSATKDDAILRRAKLVNSATAGTNVGTGTSRAIVKGRDVLIGESGGVEKVKLTPEQIPAHNHPLLSQSASSGSQSSSSNLGGWDATSTVDSGDVSNDHIGDFGGDETHDNMHPYLSLNHIIKT